MKCKKKLVSGFRLVSFEIYPLVKNVTIMCLLHSCIWIGAIDDSNKKNCHHLKCHCLKNESVGKRGKVMEADYSYHTLHLC